MLMPKRTKFRKMHKGRMRGTALRGATVACGDYGLQAVECGWASSSQIADTRVPNTRSIKRLGMGWVPETRMGKGKGNPEYWVAVIKPGRILYEVNGVNLESAKEAFRLGAAKLPFKTRVVTRRGE